MNNSIKILAIFLAITAFTVVAEANRGGGGDKPNKVILNAGRSPITSKFFPSSANGLTYTGTTVLNTTYNNNTTFQKTTIVTFQKGNTIYAQPYKQTVIVPEMKQGYTGIKLIIRPY